MSTNSFGYCENAPEEIREILMHLCQEVVHLNHAWNFYVQLFANPADMALLSEMLPASFQLIEETLRRDMTMTISRLHDPARSFGYDNLSIAALVENCTNISDLSDLYQKFVTACDPVIQYRNKLVGHKDLNTVLNPQDYPIPGIGRSQIEEIISIATTIVTKVFTQYVDCDLSFDPITKGGADELIFWLKKARSMPRQSRQ